MELKRYHMKLDKMTWTSIILLVMVFLLLISTIVQSVIIYKQRNDERWVFLPPNINQKITLTANNPDSNYLKEMAIFLLSLKLNVTPKTIDGSHQLFEEYVDSSVYGQIEQSLLEEAQQIKKGDISGTFIVTQAQADSQRRMAKITGFLNKSVGNRKIQQEVVSYLVQFSYEAGKLHLTSIEKVHA